MDPLELDLKSNPEHGLRLILTFQPATSFLVPLDRCLALASQNLFSTNCELLLPSFKLVKLPAHCLSRASNRRAPVTVWCTFSNPQCPVDDNCPVHAAKQSIHEKQEGLRFLHICLASVLNLRSPDESELSGTPLDKLASMLFGTQVTALLFPNWRWHALGHPRAWRFVLAVR